MFVYFDLEWLWLWDFYRPQTKFGGKVMFSQVSVCSQGGMHGERGVCGKGA